MDITEKENLGLLKEKLNDFDGKLINAKSIYINRKDDGGQKEQVYSVSNNSHIGTVTYDDPVELKKCLEKNDSNKPQSQRQSKSNICKN